MKFTTMQKALTAGAIGAVAVTPAMADTGYSNGGGGNNAELVLYVVNTATGSSAAYSRGLGAVYNPSGMSANTYLQLGNTAGTAIYGAVTVAGSTYTGTLANGGDTATLVAAQNAVNAIGGTTGYGSQAQINVAFSLPAFAADANLTSWLAAQGYNANDTTTWSNIKWSIQGGYASGNGASASRRFITTSAGNYDLGSSVTNSNLGMASTESNVWATIASTQYQDNLLNPSQTTQWGDGSSITNSTYFATNGNGNGTDDTAKNWFANATNSTQPALSVNPLCSIGQVCNLYMVVSNNVNSAGGGKAFTYTLNDVVLTETGMLGATTTVPVPGAAWLLLSGLGGLGVLGRRKKS